MENGKKVLESAKGLLRGPTSPATTHIDKKPRVDEEEKQQFEALKASDDMKGMMTMMFDTLSDIRADVCGVSVTAEQAKLKANQAMSVAESAEAKVVLVEQQVKAIREEFENMNMKGDNFKNSVKEIVNQSVGELGPPPRAPPRFSDSRPYIHENVVLQGFYDHKSGAGALTSKQVDDLIAKLFAYIPKEVQEGFVVEKKYNLSRRVVLKCPKGGEKCWVLREKLAEAIETNSITVDGKTLKVRVQDSPEKEAKRSMFWKAVSVLESKVSKEDFIVEPRSFGIHASSSHEMLGTVTTSSYEWDAEKMGRLFPQVCLPDLRRAFHSKNR